MNDKVSMMFVFCTHVMLNSLLAGAAGQAVQHLRFYQNETLILY